MSRSRAEDFSYSDLGCLNGIYTNIMNKNVMLTATTLLENNAILQIKLHSICYRLLTPASAHRHCWYNSCKSA